MAALLVIEFLLCLMLIGRLGVRLGFNLCDLIVAAFVLFTAGLCLLAEMLSVIGAFKPGALIVVHIGVSLTLAGLLLSRQGSLTSLLRKTKIIPARLIFFKNYSRSVDCSSSTAQLGQAQDLARPAIAIGFFQKSLTQGLLCLLLALIFSIPNVLSAVFAPPSNWDSMTYHLPKAMHWLSLGSLAHYPTYTVRQLAFNPGHEILMAHGIGLGGSDRYAGLLNAAALFIAMLASAGVVRRLNGGAFAQGLGVVFMATIPMGILQAGTTQNDLLLGTYLISALLAMLIVRQAGRLSSPAIYLETFELLKWIKMCGRMKFNSANSIGLSAFSAVLEERELRCPVRQDASFLGELMMWCAIGLAILTKGLSFLWVPALALVAFPYARYLKFRGSWRALTLGVLIVVALNLGYFARNLGSFNHLLGPQEGPFKMADLSVQERSIATFLSNFSRNLALHTNTPIIDLEPSIKDLVLWIHDLVDLDPSESRTTLPATNYGMLNSNRIHEDFAGNGGHLLLVCLSLVTCLGLLVLKREKALQQSVAISAALFGFILLCLMVRWQPWASRLQLPLFILVIPSCAVLTSRPVRGVLGLACAFILIYSAWPYWFRNELKPLVGESSIIRGEDIGERFYPQPFLRKEFERVAKRISRSGCFRVGVVSHEDDWEQGLYAFFGLRLSVVSCDVPGEYGRHLWLANKVFDQQKPCALVWFGGDVPSAVTACGREFQKVGRSGYVNLLLATRAGFNRQY